MAATFDGTQEGFNVDEVLAEADRALRIAVFVTEEARTYCLHHSAPDTEYYEGFLHAVEESSTLWGIASQAWKEYDAVLAKLRAITGKSNQELWTTDTNRWWEYEDRSSDD
jgi:hypothetical protein